MQIPYDTTTEFLGIYSQRNEKLCPYKNVYTNIQSSFIHDSQKLETTQMAFSDSLNALWHVHTVE